LYSGNKTKLVANHNAPIGVFDSGIGGLTVANAIRKLLPNENIIYFGDTAHLPYGDKSAESIRHYSVEISRHLIEKNCKAVVIACNTASSFGYNAVKRHFGNKTLIINVVDPVAEYVAHKFNREKIGVIGTKGTIGSRVYVKRINKLNKQLKVTSLATPLLVPMIEEGYFNNNISQAIINAYLSKKHFQGIKALILGCTHFPLIKKEVKHYYGQDVEIIDSAVIVAKRLQEKLTKRGLLKTSAKTNHKFYVSDYTASFEASAKLFFKNAIHLREKRLWES